MRMTKQRPFSEAQNFHHKLQILLEAIIGCKTSSEYIGVMITFNMIDVHIIVLQPSMV
jgi:hypothetical protein